jgi:leucyl/phenylalanyl-tRNA---protein transferase
MSRLERPEISWDFLLAAYASGYFPMAERHDDPHLHWFYPELRGVLPLDNFHVPRSLEKFMRKSPFTLTTNTSFPAVIRGCATTDTRQLIGGKMGRDETWINEPIIALYTELWQRGFAHSVEVWTLDATTGENQLVGGLYGVAIGGAFFGESMFSRASNASKVALVHLVELLRKAGYTLLDTQFVNDHLVQFGVQEIPRADYLVKLREAIALTPEKIF